MLAERRARWREGATSTAGRPESRAGPVAQVGIDKLVRSIGVVFTSDLRDL
jgi:hypothetical protein